MVQGWWMSSLFLVISTAVLLGHSCAFYPIAQFSFTDCNHRCCPWRDAAGPEAMLSAFISTADPSIYLFWHPHFLFFITRTLGVHIAISVLDWGATTLRNIEYLLWKHLPEALEWWNHRLNVVDLKCRKLNFVFYQVLTFVRMGMFLVWNPTIWCSQW